MEIQKLKRVHLNEIYVCEVVTHWRNGSFELKFANDKKEFVIHCERTDLRWLACELWKVIQSEQKEINSLINAMQEG